MYTALQKIHLDKDAEPTEFKETIAQALFDLETTNQGLRVTRKIFTSTIQCKSYLD
ncbi:40S ribosomal S7-like [Olea europaea subsp. europaea]|uniref:40S ribosomal S7-like n=1 Tax=Olea europaea subsp. europaea TaxID=158383 RepID=A0A8S0SPL0_OLEEU|nr:40S ribosomal S7-like [Olea europaea subsp. europaea]